MAMACHPVPDPVVGAAGTKVTVTHSREASRPVEEQTIKPKSRGTRFLTPLLLTIA